MNRKNTYIRKTLILLCLMTAPSFYLLSSYYTPRIAAGKRPQGYKGPRNIRQKRIIPTAEPKPIIDRENIAPVNQNQPMQEIDEIQPEPTVTSQAMPSKSVAASPGWLMTSYMIVLSTLNKAFGTGIEASNRTFVKKFMARQAFKNIQDQATNEAKTLVQSGEFDQQINENAHNLIRKYNLSPEDPEYNNIIKQVENNINTPTQEKVNSLTKSILKGQKINPDQMEKQVAFSSILKEGAYVGMLNTIIPMMGSLIGFGATMLLQSLMPTQAN